MDHAWVKILPGFFARKLEGRLNLQKIIGNTGWLFADKIIRLGVGLVVGVWIARYLGPAQYGIFNYAQAFVSLFAVFANLGLDGIVVRDIVRDPACREETLGSAFMLKLTGAFLTLLLTIGSVTLLRPNDNLTCFLVAIIAAGTIFQAFDVIDFWFQSQVLSKFTVIARNISFLTVSAVKIVLILKHAPLVAFALAGLVEIMLASAALLAMYRIHGHHLAFRRGSVSRAKQLLNESWPLILSGLAIMVYMQIDQVMLREMIGNEELGLYSAALRFSEVWYFIPTAIVSSVFPSIVGLKKISEEAYYEQIGKLFKLLVLVAYFIAIPLSILSKHVIPLVYGVSYQDAGTILSIHIWASMFVFIGVGQGPWNLTEGYMKLSLQRTIAGAVLNVAINLVLIPLYGGIGAAIATVIAYGTSAFLMNAFDRRTRNIFSLQMKALLLAKG